MASEARRRSPSFRERIATREPQALAVQLPSLWKAMIITSFLINLILIFVILYLLGFVLQNRGPISATTQNIAGNVSELQDVVNQLQAAHITTTIPLNQPLPVHLMVPVNTTTIVTTTQPVTIAAPADIDLGPFGRLHPNVNLDLPPGTPLKIALNFSVPLDTTIPVKLDVPVDIPMEKTALAPQFRRLGAVLNRLLSSVGPLIGVDIPQSPPVQTPTKPQ
jgi:hypothetical protein